MARSSRTTSSSGWNIPAIRLPKESRSVSISSPSSPRCRGWLARHFEVIVPEHPGFGGSDTPDWLDTVGDLAYFYLDVIDALKLSCIHLVGTSLGGWIAAEIAVRSCASLETLTLSAAVGINVKGVPKGDLFMWSREQLVRNL